MFFYVIKGLLDSFFQKDYLDPCVYGNIVDKSVNFNVNGNNDEKFNHHFKDLNP